MAKTFHSVHTNVRLYVIMKFSNRTKEAPLFAYIKGEKKNKHHM